ncbi:hypothetical protein [Actinacidiphila acidipaludis]|uniref:Uncharacterized protein n=1 Tax=Actinacidiphila acidipaludis TaxID=2873382 RepID=A0ABS7QID3_9ACTN|nr:hypothetical protein [Streptomyces acidipaludis]MBY8882556.1 hypothetical protein [Streptomyces acidipaludis]
MNEWLRARNGLTRLLVFWAITFTGGLLGEVADRLFWSRNSESVTANLPVLTGGSLFMAGCAVVARRHRRRRRG